MSEPVAPDTHALLWYLTDDRRLSAAADNALTQADETNGEIVVSVIVLVELLRLIEKRKAQVPLDELLKQLTVRPNVKIMPVDMQVFRQMIGLDAALEMHDRIIVATAVITDATVITKDRQISAAVRTTW